MKNNQNDKKWFPAKYVSRFLNLHSAEDLMSIMQCSNTLKEITESMGMYYCVTDKICSYDDTIDLKKEDSVGIFVFGDGVLPRTGAIFAYLTKWNVWSLDPLMKKHKDIKRLFSENITAEKFIELNKIEIFSEDTVILIFPHSHVADVNRIYKAFSTKKVWIINMPCCNPGQCNSLKLHGLTYHDKDIMSEKNKIQLFCNYKELKFV